MSLEKLLEGAELAPEVASQLTQIFESEVSARLEAEKGSLTESIREEVKTELTVQYDAILESSKEEIKTELVEHYDSVLESAKEEISSKLDGFVSYIAEKWLDDNRLAVESGVKVELAEKVFSSIQSVLSENNILMDVEGIAKIEEAESKVSQLDEKLQTAIQELQTLKQEKLVLEQNAIIASVASDLAETQKEKLMEMVSPYRSIKDLKAFEAKVETLKESAFKVDEETPGLVKESTVTSATDSTSDMDENVLRYAQFMAKNK